MQHGRSSGRQSTAWDTKRHINKDIYNTGLNTDVTVKLKTETKEYDDVSYIGGDRYDDFYSVTAEGETETIDTYFKDNIDVP